MSSLYYVNENDDSVCLSFRNIHKHRTIGLLNTKPMTYNAGVCIVSNSVLPTGEITACNFLLLANVSLSLLIAVCTEGPTSTVWLASIYFIGLYVTFHNSPLGIKMFAGLLGSSYLLAENPLFYRIPLDVISLGAAFHVSRPEEIAWIIPDPHRRQS